MARAAVATVVQHRDPLQLRVGPRDRHLVDTTLFFAPTSGGVRRYLLAKHAWMHRHTRMKHTILVPGRDDAGLPYGVVSLASPRLPFVGGYRIPLRLRAFRERLTRLTPDLVEVADPYHVAWQALRVARNEGFPVVAFCHSDLIAVAGALGGEPARAAAARYLRRLYAEFDLVLAPSQTLAGRLRQIGVASAEVQPLGVDAVTLTPAASDPELRRRLDIHPASRLLVFAGRFSPEKRIRDLLAAAELLGARYHLLLVGAARAGRVAPNVTLLEYQQDSRALAAILASSDAFVHAGDQETFGLVVLEAMACGLPVVAAHAGALPELVDETVGATFPPRDPRALARAVDGVFARDLRSLSVAARRRAEACSWDRVFTQLIGRYARLMDGRAPAASRGRHAV